MTERLYRLPSDKVLRRRLKKVDDNPHVVQYLHSRIIRDLKEDDGKLRATGIMALVGLALIDYAASSSQELPRPLYYMDLRRYVTAIVGDRRVREQVLELIDEATRR